MKNVLPAVLYRSLASALLVCILFTFQHCVTISPFDQYAYSQTTSLKVEALNVMDQAANDYAAHENEVKEVELKMQKCYEYELHRAKNTVTVAMWKLLMDPDKNLMGGFLKRWKNEKQLNPAFITEAKPQIEKAFDQIAELESGKIKPRDVQP